LLETDGPDAVTTRSVALAAGVQAPAIYRLFGDKDGLLQAVAEYGFARYLAQKPPVDTGDDPLADLRAGWDLHVGFGLANPALFRLMHAAPPAAEARLSIDAGADVLRRRVQRIAQAGRLRVTETRAIDLIRAAGLGIVFTLIDQPEGERDYVLAELAWESICAVILTEPAQPADVGPTAAAVTLRAALPSLEGFSIAERALFRDWLDRAAEG
jgi:AcrR family transcriptional regulator